MASLIRSWSPPTWTLSSQTPESSPTELSEAHLECIFQTTSKVPPCSNEVKARPLSLESFPLLVDRGIDFFQFEIALELVSEKKGVSKSDVRSAMIQQGVPKATASNQVVRMVRPKDNARLMSEKRIAAILRRSPRELQSERSVDNSELWRSLASTPKPGAS